MPPFYLIRATNGSFAAGGDALFTAKEARCFPETAFGFVYLPSARLSAQGVRDLGKVIERLTNEGIAVVFITHKSIEARQLMWLSRNVRQVCDGGFGWPRGALNILATFKQRFAFLACAREARIKNGRHSAGI